MVLSAKKRNASHPLGDAPSNQTVFNGEMSIFHEEILIIERTNMDVAVFIIADRRIS
jgi:hypothetical protein